MKVLVSVILALGSVSARGSGPYLPSGWRPDGPAFYLPSEPRQPAVASFKTTEEVIQGSEASGSDFLRDYGPPKLQSLPNEVTEQSFVVLEAKFGEEGGSVESVTEVIAEVKSALVEYLEPTTTESIVSESVEEVTALAEQSAAEGKSLNIEVEAEAEEIEVTTQREAEATQAVISDEAEIKAKIQTEVTEEARTVEEGVNNIAEAIINLEKEVFAQQVQIAQDVNEFKSVEQSSGALVQVPEGFLEYGPPGFKEYGPPKEETLPRSADITNTEEEKIENNVTRRRRFSPKFRSTKNH